MRLIFLSPLVTALERPGRNQFGKEYRAELLLPVNIYSWHGCLKEPTTVDQGWWRNTQTMCNEIMAAQSAR